LPEISFLVGSSMKISFRGGGPCGEKVRRSGFILPIDENKIVWPYPAPRIYTDRT